MAKSKQNSISEMDIEALVRQGELTSEMDLQRASLGVNLLGVESKHNPALVPLRRKLVSMIIAYEAEHWSGKQPVSDEQVEESDLAEQRVAAEMQFLKDRKERILKSLEQYTLNQNDLAAILAHSKSYTSELLNGIRSFSMNDLIIIHRLFKINLEDLIFTEISADVEERIRATIQKSTKNALKTRNPAQVASLVKALYSKNAVTSN